MNESETRVEYIDSKLKASGWGEVEANLTGALIWLTYGNSKTVEWHKIKNRSDGYRNDLFFLEFHGFSAPAGTLLIWIDKNEILGKSGAGFAVIQS